MYCPQCGTESQSTQYCRVCGANLKAIDKDSARGRTWISFGKKKTAAEKREDHIAKGVVSLFSGAGISVFLYFLSAALVLKLPPEVIEQIPFEIEPVLKMIWLFGLLPATSGVGHIIAGLLIRPRPEQQQLDQVVSSPRELDDRPISSPISSSVTDHTTNLLAHERINSKRN